MGETQNVLMFPRNVTDGAGKALTSFTILTVDSSKKLEWLHDRMPAILPTREAVDEWLRQSSECDTAVLVEKVSWLRVEVV